MIATGGALAIVWGWCLVVCFLLVAAQAVLAWRRLGGWELLALAVVGVAVASFVGYLTVTGA